MQDELTTQIHGIAHHLHPKKQKLKIAHSNFSNHSFNIFFFQIIALIVLYSTTPEHTTRLHNGPAQEPMALGQGRAR